MSEIIAKEHPLYETFMKRWKADGGMRVVHGGVQYLVVIDNDDVRFAPERSSDGFGFYGANSIQHG